MIIRFKGTPEFFKHVKGCVAAQYAARGEFQQYAVSMIFADGSVLLEGEEEGTYVVETYPTLREAEAAHSN